MSLSFGHFDQNDMMRNDASYVGYIGEYDSHNDK